jgi:hypothetical protein
MSLLDILAVFSPAPHMRAADPLNGLIPFLSLIAFFCVVIGAVNIYHLGCAYRRYLRFDHPWATIAATQIIVGLIFCVLAVNMSLLLLR